MKKIDFGKDTQFNELAPAELQHVQGGFFSSMQEAFSDTQPSTKTVARDDIGLSRDYEKEPAN